MERFHESGCFIQRKENAILLNKLPGGVREFRIHYPNGSVKENFMGKVFYFDHPQQQLEVVMNDGSRRFFEYEDREKRFVELYE